MTEPDLILADGPTGASDTSPGQPVLALLQQLHRGFDKNTVVVIRDSHAAQFASRTLELEKRANDFNEIRNSRPLR